MGTILLALQLAAAAGAHTHDTLDLVSPPPAEVQVLPPVDSAAVVRNARRAQQRFEVVRRAHLPISDSPPRSTCEARVGRFCYWQDDDETAPRPEHRNVADERGRLLESLAAAARALPHDEWIVGQEVRYLIDAGRAEDAIAAARRCRAEGWWCESLLGTALHVSGEFAAANEAFDRALASMPERTSCAWRDISPLLDDPHRRSYSRLPCARRIPLEHRFWRLSQPLYILGANDLRSEHFARRVTSRLEEQARGAYDVSWGSDVEELLVRYGWPTSWSRARESQLGPPGFGGIIGTEPVPNWQFAVNGRLLHAPLSEARPDDWQLRPTISTSRYAAPYARSFRELRHQTARFLRGDSALFVSVIDPSEGSAVGGIAEAALAVIHVDGDGERVARTKAGDRRAAIRLTAPADSLLVSLELMDRERKEVRRARFGVAPPERSGRLRISDLLLHAPADSATATLDEVVPLALASMTIDASARPAVAVYWEGYGIRAAGETIHMTLALERMNVTRLQRAAARMRLRGPIPRPLHIRWSEARSGDVTRPGRSLTIDVSGIEPGRYVLSVTIAGRDGAAATAHQLIDIVRSAR